MGVASGCGEQEVGVASGIGWNLWVWLLGVVVRRYIDFLILLIPTPLVSVLFYSSIPSFCSFKKKFFFFMNTNIFINDLPPKLKATSKGICFGDTLVCCLLYVDDLVILAESEQDLQVLLCQLEE